MSIVDKNAKCTSTRFRAATSNQQDSSRIPLSAELFVIGLLFLEQLKNMCGIGGSRSWGGVSVDEKSIWNQLLVTGCTTKLTQESGSSHF